jgi:hypothetical protein
MPAKSKRRRFTAPQINEHIRTIQKAINKHKRMNKGEHFTAVTREEIEKKLKRVNSPMIISQGWSGTAPGGTVNYNLGVYNPDPTQAIWVFAHVWVGSGNIDRTVGTFLLNVDTRFPRLTEPVFDGLMLAAGAFAILNFTIKVPSTVEETNYLGNSCLMQFNWHDLGTYLDRGVFVFAVSSGAAVDSDLVSGATGTAIQGQSYSETRAVDVTVLSPSDLAVERMVLDGYLLYAGCTAVVGARIYDSSTNALVSTSSDVNLSGPSIAIPISIPVSATLVSGRNYRIGFSALGNPSSSGNFFVPSFPYTESTGLFRINSAWDDAPDAFPQVPNLFAPRVTIRTRSL